MTTVIDAITHQLTGAHIAREIHSRHLAGESSLQIVCEVYRGKQMMNAIRSNLSQYFDKIGLSKENRYGLRASDPFPYSFDDGRPGRFYCIHLNIYRSPGKAMMKALMQALDTGVTA